jgi:glycosyltransferase involved in cell wall biosynthesis
MATGTPVIARRAGAYPEIIDHGITGYLIDDRDEAVLAVGRAHRLERHVIAAQARDRFSLERMTIRYEEAFRTVLERSRDAAVPHLLPSGSVAPDQVRPVATAAGVSG